jgi:probable rRNA maturation factor
MVTVECLGKLPAGFTKAKVAELVSASCKRAGFRGAATVGIRVVDDRAIRTMNRIHRGKDKVTDVLSFSATEGLPKAMAAGAKGELGDVVIALPQVRRQARAIGRSPKDEFALMVVHGTLHLLGFDHESVKDEAKMFALQHDILIRAGIL